MAESTVFAGEWPVQVANGGEQGCGRADEELCKSPVTSSLDTS